MKNVLLLLVLSLIVKSGTAQGSESTSKFLQENYVEGEKSFLITIYQQVNFPVSARNNCRMGKLKNRLTISPEGRVVKMEFLNFLGDGIEEEVVRMIQLVEGGWKKIEEDSMRTLDLVFAFQIGVSPEVKGDINIIADGTGCMSNEFWLGRLEKFMKKEKYDKAKEVTEELLKRDPDSRQFQQLDRVVSEKLKM